MISFFLISQVSSRNHRVLFLLDQSEEKELYSDYIEDLKNLGCKVSFASTSAESIHLERFGEKIYDTVVVAGSSSHCFGKEIDEFKDFVDNGGNAIIFSVGNNDLQDKIYRHLSHKTINSQKMGDIFGKNVAVLRNLIAPKAVISKDHGPILYNGGFAQIERPNDFRFPIYTGGLEHKLSTAVKMMSGTPIKGPKMVPISAFQARTGGRIVIIQSPTFAQSTTFLKKIHLSANLETIPEGQRPSNANRQVLKELSEWVTHYKSHARVVNSTHYDAVTKVSPVQYHIRQNITIVADLEYTKDGEWVKYEEEDVQVEIFMLGTFIRRHMKKVGPGHFTETLMLPDRAGNYKIKVFTAKDGWFNAREEMAIAIRPLAIREKEKFLECAQPYQLSMMLIMAATFIASIHFLYHKPQEQIETSK